jgi:uncharacterized glyoxalase superfamily protein PhnB
VDTPLCKEAPDAAIKPESVAGAMEAVIMVASNDAAYQRPPLIGRSTGQGLYLLVGDVDAFHQKALAAGGTSVIEPEDTQWGTRRSRVLDPQGQEWSAGTYQPGTNS